jgi:cobalt-precorrin-5B (C1)-methyltransferase
VLLLRKWNLQGIFDTIAQRASSKASEYVWQKLRVGTVITAREGRILGLDESAEDLGRLMGCKRLR